MDKIRGCKWKVAARGIMQTFPRASEEGRGGGGVKNMGKTTEKDALIYYIRKKDNSIFSCLLNNHSFYTLLDMIF